MSKNDKEFVGYCSYCKEPIYEDDEYVIRNGKFYHGFCYVQLHTYDNDFHFNKVDE